MDADTVQLRQRGVLTLPKELRDRYGLRAGDALRVVDLDGVFILTPMVPMVPELAREIERLRTEAGLSMEELLDGLRRQREQVVREQYGADFLEKGARASAPGTEARGRQHDQADG